MVVDTNSIPSSAVQRVEIISGGASAVYGADAVGGVVNFILKDNYEGASIDVRLRRYASTAATRPSRCPPSSARTPPTIAATSWSASSATRVQGLRLAARLAPRGFRESERRRRGLRLRQRDLLAQRARREQSAHQARARTIRPRRPSTRYFRPSSGLLSQPESVLSATRTRRIACQIVEHAHGDRHYEFPGQQGRQGSTRGWPLTRPAWRSGAYRFNGPVYGDPGSPGGDLDGQFQGLPVFVRQANGVDQGKQPLHLDLDAARAALRLRQRPLRRVG